jgi:hypothetical protein
MARAAEALGKFILIASEEAQCSTIQEAIGRSGLSDLPQPVLMVMFSLLAQSMLGKYWDALRASALPELVSPMFSKEMLQDSAEVMQKVLSGKTNMDLENAMRDMKKWATAPMIK